MENLISIIVPVYNVENYIHECIDSLLNQSYKNIEVILVDDGSTDKSGMICDEYSKIDKRVKVIHKKNEGLGFARNSGLQIATGKYVTFVDSDDYVGEDRIKKLYLLLQKYNADVCLSGFTRVFQKNKQVCTNPYSSNVFFDNISRTVLPKMCGADGKGLDQIPMSVWLGLYSNDIIKKEQIKFVSERKLISEDLVFDFSYYPYVKKVCISNTTDYFYRDNPKSLTTRYRADRFEKQIILYEEILNRAKQLNIADECQARLDNTLISIARYCIKLEYKYEAINGTKYANERVKYICNNELLQNRLNNFDDSHIKISSRIINALMKKKLYLCIKIIMKIKNKLNI